ncbi:DUF1549 domain-containing protein [Gimesia fumaroli]|uniref:WD domain, G-beta repeat n=1 Tax=Gimesia fumaroli TaxID=2527976 RepID=A0A518ICW7_9PLAN|nr:DUF1549 domain-containing protein [Gimesia fumaroli]QDV50937.1 WD domain, G-beta repeat [Gimesia fumaroli]
MSFDKFRTFAFYASVFCVFSCSHLFAANPPAAKGKVSFYQQVRPILQAQCVGCHHPRNPEGSYVVTEFSHLLKGGESETTAIVPGQPDKSYLVELITPEGNEAEMPKAKTPLSQDQITLIRTWIQQGAIDDSPQKIEYRFNKENPPTYSAPPVITSLAYSPDGKLLAVAGFHEVLLHAAEGNKLVGRLIGKSQRIESVQFSPDGKYLAVSGGTPAERGEIQIWDVAKQTLKKSIPLTYDTLYGASWSPDGKLLAFGCADNTVRAIEVETGKEVFYQNAHYDWVLDTVFSTDGSHIISVSRDRTTKLAELKTQRFIDNITSITPKALTGGLAAIDRHPTQDTILVGGADGVPKLYQVFRQSKRVIGDDANLVRSFPALKGRIFGVAIHPQGKQLVAVSSLNHTGELKVFSFDIGEKIPDDLVKILNKRVASRSAEEKKQVAESRTKSVKLVSEVKVPETGLYTVCYDPKGDVIATAGQDGQVRLYESQTGKLKTAFVPVPLQKDQPELVEKKGAAPKSKLVLVDVNQQKLPKEEFSNSDPLVKLEVQPATATIAKKYDTIQFLVTGHTKSGAKTDLTRLVKVALNKQDTIHVSPTGLVRALQPGITDVSFSLHGVKATAKITVAEFPADYSPDYWRDVAPAFTKMGCNSGLCHGANKGKDGFKLSLRGTDDLFDLRAFTDDLKSRRVNLASPEQSLILLKAIAEVPHKGGQVALAGDAHYQIVSSWIKDGTPLNKEAPRVASIKITPENPVVPRAGLLQQFRVLATYDNGEVRDVTSDSFIDCSNIEIAKMYHGGIAEVLRRGEAPLLARYQGKYAATTVTVMGDRSEFAWKQLPVHNYIDKLVDQKLKKTKTLPSGLCTDAEFIRRVYIDLTGLPPTIDDVKAFLADKRESKIKRNELIDRLLGSKEFVEHWTNKWADLLQVNRKYLGTEGSKLFRDWIRKSVAENVPYDQFAYQILSASGSNKEVPAASYFKIHRTPEDTMENTTHLFLSIRFNCNKCHDHPFERWTQDQYYETSAFFAQFDLKNAPESKGRTIGGTAVEGRKPLFEVVFDKKEGEMIHERTGAKAPPKFPYPAEFKAEQKDLSRRETLARWITSRDNQYFAKAYANRVWGYLTGTGLIEPIDDIRAGNPPSNPELLERLTADFLSHDFDIRHLMRVICQSRTYQLSIESNKWNEDDTINYSHAKARRLPAEVLYDSLCRVTGSLSNIPGVPAGTRAAELPDVGFKLKSDFLAKFGRAQRESPCECERSSGVQLGPVMALISGPTVGNAISDPNNALNKLVQEEKDDVALIDSIFLRVLNRPATEEEKQAGIKLIQQQIQSEHQALTKRLAAYEKGLPANIIQQENQRVQNIQDAQQAVTTFQQAIAPREAWLNNEQKERTARFQKALTDYQKSLQGKIEAWEKAEATGTKWIPLKPETMSATNKANLELQKDLSILAKGPNGKGDYQIVAHTNLKGISAVRLDVLTDDSLPRKGPGRSGDGNFVLNEFEVYAAPKSKPDQKTKLTLFNAQADFSQNTYDVKTAIDGQVKPQGNGWAVAPQTGKSHKASFDIQSQVAADAEGTILTFVLKQQFNSNTHSIGRFRLSVSNGTGPTTLDKHPKDILAILKKKSDKRNAAEKKKLLEYYSKADSQLQAKLKAVAESKKPRPTDPKLVELRNHLTAMQAVRPVDRKLTRLRNDVRLSAEQVKQNRLVAAQDLTWALINSPAFLFNH